MRNPLMALFAKNRENRSALRIVKGAPRARVAGGDDDGDGDAARDNDFDESADNAATIYVYDVIGGTGRFDDEITAKSYCQAIDALDVATIHLRINSPGGDVFEARAIKSSLERHRARVIAYVDGWAASSASFLMMAADEIRIAPGAFVMIHNPWSFAIGDARDMRKQADILDQVRDAIAGDYQRRTGLDVEMLRAMMDDETWIEASDAVAMKFCDCLLTEAPAQARAQHFDLSAYRNPPKSPALPAPADAFAQIECERARAAARVALF